MVAWGDGLAGVGSTIDADEPKVNVGGVAELPGGFIFKNADPLPKLVEALPNPALGVLEVGGFKPNKLPLDDPKPLA